MKKINYLNQLIEKRENFYIKLNFTMFMIIFLVILIGYFLVNELRNYIIITCLKIECLNSFFMSLEEKNFFSSIILNSVELLFTSYVFFIIICNIFINIYEEKGVNFSIFKLKEKIIRVKEKYKKSFKDEIQKNYSLNQENLRYELKNKIRKEYSKKEGLFQSLSLKKAPFILLGSIFYSLVDNYYKSLFQYPNQNNEIIMLFYNNLKFLCVVFLFIVIFKYYWYIFYEDFFKTNKLNTLHELEELLYEISRETKYIKNIENEL